MSAAPLVAPRPGYVRRERSRLEQIALLSLLAHLLLLAVIVEARYLTGKRPEESQEPGFQVVFGAPTDAVQTVQPEVPPPASQSPVSQPQVNLSPDEYVPPPPPLPEAQDIMPVPRPRPPPPRPHRAPSANPFLNMPLYGFANGPARRAPPPRPRGLDLATDSVSQGGRTAEANPDISAPGADGDFIAKLSEYVETHKYYPDLAVRNGEAGMSVIKAVFNRDGSVKSVQLLRSSGSRTLDVAWMDLFRHKVVAPFSMTQATQEVILSMDFELVQQY
jgi:TonB family protein